jgi:hypothetical protein
LILSVLSTQLVLSTLFHQLIQLVLSTLFHQLILSVLSTLFHQLFLSTQLIQSTLLNQFHQFHR